MLIYMLAYYLTWHLKAAWKPLLFTDEDRPVSPDPVAKAVRSPAPNRPKNPGNEPDSATPRPGTSWEPADGSSRGALCRPRTCRFVGQTT
jgi:hypothetical protein